MKLFQTIKKYSPLIALGVIMLAVSDQSFAASTNTEFKAPSTKLNDWALGDYGKAAATLGLMAGVGTAAWTKDFGASLKGAGLALIIPIVGGIINGGFTAVI